MDKFDEFVSRYEKGVRYNLTTLEEGDGYPCMIIKDSRIKLYPTINSDIHIIMSRPYLGYYGTTIYSNGGLLSSRTLKIEQGIAKYIENCEKPFEEILRDISNAMCQFIEMIENFEFVVPIPKKAI